MKRSFSLFFFLLVCNLSAQRTAMITDGSTEYDKKTLPSLVLSIDAPVDAVYEPWQDFWEERYSIDIDRADKDRNSIAYLAPQVSVPAVGEKNVDLYTNVYGDDQGSKVALSLAYSDSDVVNRAKYPSAYAAGKALLEEFRTYFYTTYFDNRISETREALESMKEDSADASKDVEKARSKMKKYEKKIDKLRRKIDDTREEVGDDIQTSEEKTIRIRELEDQLQQLQQSRRTYLG